MDIFAVFFTACAVALAWVYFTPKAKSSKKIPNAGYMVLPYFGNLLEAIRIHHLLSRASRMYPKIFRLFLFSAEIIVVGTPDAARQILGLDNWPKNPAIYADFARLVGQGLVVANGDSHRQQRKLINPGFHFTKLRQLEGVFAVCGAVFRRNLQRLPQGEPVELAAAFRGYAMDVICRSAFGVAVDSQTSPDSRIVDAAHASLDGVDNQTMLKRITNALPSGKRRFQEARQFLLQTVREEMKKRQALKAAGQEVAAKDILQLLVDAAVDGECLSDELILDNSLTFFVAGHETTASALPWTLALLIQHPAAMARAVAAVDALYEAAGKAGETEGKAEGEGEGNAPSAAAAGDSDGDVITWEMLRGAPYLDMVLKESLRKYPPVAFIPRMTPQKTRFDGLAVPKGMDVWVSVSTLHNDPQQWSHPDQFYPEHFSAEETRGRHPFAFVPFSAGPRGCIGRQFAMLEMKYLLIILLRHWTLALHPGCVIEPTVSITQKLKNGLAVFLTPRQPAPAA